MHSRTDIPVTQPSLPPLEEFTELLADIWERKWLTNNGHYHQLFEQALAEHLGVRHLSLFCNGMIALQIGLQALEATGEIITTPYSFPATTHAIHWNHCTPVFCDIDEKTCNLNPARIEALITPKTTCILPVHVYGIPCDTEAIRQVADKHGLKVIYDAAHAFGVEINNQSILHHGDLSMLSFHATKVFNTIEGGALITNDENMKRRIDRLKNFGYAGETEVVAPGTNGKMHELQAAYGLLQLKYIQGQLDRCREIAETYRQVMTMIPGIRLLDEISGVKHNNAYFPIFIDEQKYGISRDQLYLKLKENGVLSRRYFYPLISSFPYYNHLPSAAPANLPVAEKIAAQVICLPIYADLDKNDQYKIAESLLSFTDSG